MNYQKFIRNIRSKEKLTQEDFARKLFISRSLVASWESGILKPSNEHISLICSTFNIGHSKSLRIKSRAILLFFKNNIKIIVSTIALILFLILYFYLLKNI